MHRVRKDKLFLILIKYSTFNSAASACFVIIKIIQNKEGETRNVIKVNVPPTYNAQNLYIFSSVTTLEKCLNIFIDGKL